MISSGPCYGHSMGEERGATVKGCRYRRCELMLGELVWGIEKSLVKITLYIQYRIKRLWVDAVREKVKNEYTLAVNAFLPMAEREIP